MVFIGLDSASKKFGFSLLDTEKLTWFGTTIERTTGKSESFNSSKHPYDLWNQIEVLLPEDHKNVVIGIEKYFLKRGLGKGVLPWMQGFMAAKISSFYNDRVRVQFVGSQEWKKELIGFKTSGKEFVEDYVKRQARAERLKITIGTQIKDKEDTYDAMGIAYFLWKTHGKKVKR